MEGDESPNQMLEVGAFASFANFAKNLNLQLIAGIAVVSGIAILAPDSWIERLRLTDFRNSYGPWIGGTFLCSTSLLVIHGMFSPSFHRWITRGMDRRKKRKRLGELTPHEDLILSQYIDRESHTVDFDIRDSSVISLVNAGILYQSAPGAPIGATSFTIHDWVWDYLNQHPEILRSSVRFRARNEVKPKV